MLDGTVRPARLTVTAYPIVMLARAVEGVHVDSELEALYARQRRRTAFILLLVGVVLLTGGVLLIFQHRIDLATTRDAASPSHLPTREMQVIAIQMTGILLVMLVGIFGVSIIAFRRWSRGYRKFIFHKPRNPTPSEDVWALHKHPEEDELFDDQASESD